MSCVIEASLMPSHTQTEIGNEFGESPIPLFRGRLSSPSVPVQHWTKTPPAARLRDAQLATPLPLVLLHHPSQFTGSHEVRGRLLALSGVHYIYKLSRPNI
ncbi:hypothetical protein BaRGS_00036062 [Batillaria attramentaria]|uniref:Uncharacterized protein n=1 Tax=Batillaria attramentaria TaxID=370345 RepID=A0ABD0JD29_9CAEN